MSLNRKLRTLAEQLPPYPKLDVAGNMLTTKVVKYGSEILAKNENAKDRDGKPLDAKAKYLQPVPVMCNHFKQMKAIVTANPGKNVEALINEYMANVYAYHNVKAEVKLEPTANVELNNQ